MGRWSRQLARAFLAWLRPATGGHWLEIGCGTGSLTTGICTVCAPRSVVACDPSAAFVEYSRRALQDVRTSFVVASADGLPTRAGVFDVVVSGLVLNFVPEPARALVAMRQHARPGGTLAAYVWDYAGGMEFLRYFWDEAVALDPAAAAVDEARRFGHWQPSLLASLFRESGFARVEADVIEIPTDFTDFDDYWTPFLGGTGPAPSYVDSLDQGRRDVLRARLEERLPRAPDGRIALRARACVARGASS